MNTRKAPNENEVRKWLEEGQLALPPLRFTLRGVHPEYPDRGLLDFEIEAQWGDHSAVFAVEYKSVFTPKAFQQTLNQCRVARLPANRYPLVMLPYLRPEQLEELESNGISGVDWCGNGVVIVRDKIRVFRSGGRNQFATYSPIKNVYRKNTSMVARLLLTEPRFTSLQEILVEVNRRNLFVQKADAIAMSMGTDAGRQTRSRNRRAGPRIHPAHCSRGPIMDVMPNLRSALLDLLDATRDDNLRLIIGGGYGIYLKREHVRQPMYQNGFSRCSFDLLTGEETASESGQLWRFLTLVRFWGFGLRVGWVRGLTGSM